LGRAVTRCGRTHDLGGQEEVETRNEVRAANLLDVHQGVEGHHMAVLVADVEFPDLIGLVRELRLRLEENFEDATKADNIVEVKPTQVRLQGLKNAVKLYAGGRRFFPVERDV
jgi:hypothetical protein